MKFKKSSLKSLGLIAFIIGILFITGTLAIITDKKVKVDSAKLDKGANKIKTNNSAFEIQWDFDTTGYGADGRFYMRSSDFKSIDKNRTVYIGLITPTLINDKNTISITQKQNIKNIRIQIEFCDSSKYGWEILNQQLWCNITHPSNSTNIIAFDEKILINTTLENNLIITASNLTILYNITTYHKENVKTDLSKNLIKSQQTDIKSYLRKLDKDFSLLGNNWVLINQPINLVKGESNQIEFKLDIAKKDLPLKYSVVIIDANDNSYIILDPTIVNARTWSTNDDFTNGTVVTNLTTSASGITLSAGSSILSQNGIVSYYNLENVYTDNQSNNNLAAGGSGNSFSATKVLGAYSLNMSGSGWASTDTVTKMPINNEDWSVALWYQLPTLPASAVLDTAFCYGDSATWQNSFYFGVYNDGGIVKYIIQNPSGGTGAIANPININTNTWYFSVYTWNGTPQYSNIYHNAVLNWSVDQTVNYALNAERLGIGRVCHGGGSLFPGLVDEVSVFNYTLTQEDITALYNSGNGITYPLQNSAKTTGIYSDTQSWTPQTGNQITNISITADNSSGGQILFRSNSVNASLSGTAYTTLVNGTQILQINSGVDNPMFYDFMLNNTGTGKIVSYTVYENSISGGASSSCTWTAGAWTIQGSENCGLNTTNVAGNNIIFNGTGQARILANQRISSCGNVQVLNTAVGVASGGKLCS